MIKTYTISITIIYCIFILNSCNKDDILITSGKKTFQQKATTNFKAIHIQGIFDITLIPDTAYFIELIGDKNLLEETNIHVEKTTLKCYNNSKFVLLTSHEKVKLSIHFITISDIIIDDACTITNTDSLTDSLIIRMNTTIADINLTFQNTYLSFKTKDKAGGLFIFKGKTKNCNLTASYISKIDAQNLEATNVTIQNNSIQDFYIWATNQIIANRSKTGKIYYKGNPQTIQTPTDSSFLCKMVN